MKKLSYQWIVLAPTQVYVEVIISSIGNGVAADVGADAKILNLQNKI